MFKDTAERFGVNFSSSNEPSEHTSAQKEKKNLLVKRTAFDVGMPDLSDAAVKHQRVELEESARPLTPEPQNPPPPAARSACQYDTEGVPPSDSGSRTVLALGFDNPSDIYSDSHDHSSA